MTRTRAGTWSISTRIGSTMPRATEQARIRSRLIRPMGAKCGIIGGRRPEARFEPCPAPTRSRYPRAGFLCLPAPAPGYCWHALLQADLFGEPLVNRSGAICLNVTEQSGGAALMNNKILYQAYGQ